MRRSSLRRGDSQLKRSELKRSSTRMNRRSAIPKVSERHKDYQAEIDALRPKILKRCKGMCERCGESPAVLLHHRHRRSQGGANTMQNLAALCDADHRWVHSNVALAFEQGWLRRSS